MHSYTHQRRYIKSPPGRRPRTRDSHARIRRQGSTTANSYMMPPIFALAIIFSYALPVRDKISLISEVLRQS